MSTRRTFLFFLLLLGLALLKHAWLARYAHPMGDDWSYAYQGITQDLLPWLKSEYLHWNGRYFSNIIVGSGPLVLGLDHLWLYRLIPIALMVLTIIAMVALVRSLTGRALRPWQHWAGGLILFALYIHAMPDIGEGFYWYTGAITYQLANALCFLYLASLARQLNGRWIAGGTVHVALNVVLLAMIVGSSEVHMMLMCAIHAFVFLIRWKAGRRMDVTSAVVLSMLIASTAVVVLAPGNEGRGANFSGRHDLLHSLSMSFMQTGRFFLTWTSSISLLLLSVLYIPISRDLSRHLPFFQRSFHLSPAMSGILLLSTIFLCVFPAYWSTGLLGQHRTVNVAYFFFLPMWFINLTVWSNSRYGAWLHFNMPRWFLQLTLLLVLVHLSLTRNAGRANGDLFTGRAVHFDEQMDRRYAVVEAARNTSGPVVLNAIADPPQSLYLLELRDDPTDWVNRAYALYFGLGEREIVLRDDPQ